MDNNFNKILDKLFTKDILIKIYDDQLNLLGEKLVYINNFEIIRNYENKELHLKNISDISFHFDKPGFATYFTFGDFFGNRLDRSINVNLEDDFTFLKESLILTIYNNTIK